MSDGPGWLISILCPTRGRPDQVRELIRTAVETAAYPNRIEFVFYTDNDDPGMAVPLFTASQLASRIEVIRGDRIVLSSMWNACYERAQADVLMQCGDDIRFRTRGWDARILSQFLRYPDRIVLVHGNDGVQGAQIATHGFIHRRWVKQVGYFVPPKFASDYNDLWLTEVADALGRRIYLPDVYTEHMHPVANKGVWDRTHQERMHRHVRENVDRIWAETGAERQRDARVLQAYIDGYAASLAGEIDGPMQEWLDQVTEGIR